MNTSWQRRKGRSEILKEIFTSRLQQWRSRLIQRIHRISSCGTFSLDGKMGSDSKIQTFFTRTDFQAEGLSIRRLTATYIEENSDPLGTFCSRQAAHRGLELERLMRAGRFGTKIERPRNWWAGTARKLGSQSVNKSHGSTAPDWLPLGTGLQQLQHPFESIQGCRVST